MTVPCLDDAGISARTACIPLRKVFEKLDGGFLVGHLGSDDAPVVDGAALGPGDEPLGVPAELLGPGDGGGDAFFKEKAGRLLDSMALLWLPYRPSVRLSIRCLMEINPP